MNSSLNIVEHKNGVKSERSTKHNTLLLLGVQSVKTCIATSTKMELLTLKSMLLLFGEQQRIYLYADYAVA